MDTIYIIVMAALIVFFMYLIYIGSKKNKKKKELMKIFIDENFKSINKENIYTDFNGNSISINKDDKKINIFSYSNTNNINNFSFIFSELESIEVIINNKILKKTNKQNTNNIKSNIDLGKIDTVKDIKSITIRLITKNIDTPPIDINFLNSKDKLLTWENKFLIILNNN